MNKEFLQRLGALLVGIFVMKSFDVSRGIIMFVLLFFFIAYDYYLQRKQDTFIENNATNIFKFQDKFWLLNSFQLLFFGYWIVKYSEENYLIISNLVLAVIYTVILLKSKKYQIFLINDTGILNLNENKLWPQDSIKEIIAEDSKLIINTSLNSNDIIFQLKSLKGTDEQIFISHLNKLRITSTILEANQ